MKTYYGLQSYEHKELPEFSHIGPSSGKTFLVVLSIVAMLFLVTDVLK